MKFLLLSFVILLTSCSKEQTKTLDVVYSSNWRDRWQKEVMQECKSESIKITLLLYEQNLHWTKENVSSVERFLLEDCYRHRNIVI